MRDYHDVLSVLRAGAVGHFLCVFHLLSASLIVVIVRFELVGGSPGATWEDVQI
jgi:hypothetical protein